MMNYIDVKKMSFYIVVFKTVLFVTVSAIKEILNPLYLPSPSPPYLAIFTPPFDPNSPTPVGVLSPPSPPKF